MRAVLEVGGTHVSAGVLDPEGRLLRLIRHPIDAEAPAAAVVSALAAAAREVCDGTADWVVALPGPFDYDRGIALYGAGKFAALRDVDLRAALANELGGTFSFVNDADAFALGCWSTRRQLRRLVGITLGTGIGSGWISDGAVVTGGPEVPPSGALHQLTVKGQPLETWVSRQAISQAYVAGGGEPLDVLGICSGARSGDRLAQRVLGAAMTILGETLAPWLSRFAADGLVIGGSIARSWDVLAPVFTEVVPSPRVEIVLDTERVALSGAAWRAHHATGTSS